MELYSDGAGYSTINLHTIIILFIDKTVALYNEVIILFLKFYIKILKTL